MRFFVVVLLLFVLFLTLAIFNNGGYSILDALREDKHGRKPQYQGLSTKETDLPQRDEDRE